MGGRRLELVVPAALAGHRVDLLLRRELGLSGTVIRRIKWLEDGILLDGVRVHTDHAAVGGQLLSVLVGDADCGCLVPVPGPVDVVYEDADLLVVNKAPGVLVHPGPGHYSDTLGNFISHYYKTNGIQADFHPVHRLDKGTSGLMLVAKHPHAQELLKRALHTPDFRRLYLAVCEGLPQPTAGAVDAPIGRTPGSLMERRVDPAGQCARTEYRVLRAGAARSLLELELKTGRTHQIRVHMAHLGHPLTGDFLYGTEDKALIPRPALHSLRVCFRHPITGAALDFTAPLPADMARLVP